MNNVCQYEGKTLGRLENLSLIDLSTRGWSHIMQNQVNKSYSFFEKKVDTCSMAGPIKVPCCWMVKQVLVCLFNF